LWEKDLPEEVENLLATAISGQFRRAYVDGKGNLSYDKAVPSGKRDKTRMVTLKAPHNSVVQLYDYKNK